MRIEDLIESLQRTKLIHGSLDVKIYDMELGVEDISPQLCKVIAVNQHSVKFCIEQIESKKHQYATFSAMTEETLRAEWEDGEKEITFWNDFDDFFKNHKAYLANEERELAAIAAAPWTLML